MLELGTPNLMFPHIGRELTPGNRNYLSIRLSWLLRARPSATLHEIQGLLRRANLTTMLPTGRSFVKGDAFGVVAQFDFGTGVILSEAVFQAKRRISRVSPSCWSHARFLARLVKARGFGMTPRELDSN